MAIALERYLIPMISKNQEYSYRSALVRICTSLTKGWFRQFAIDNYPRLSNLDKDLLSIAQNIIANHPLQQKKLQMWKLDPETQAIFDSINVHTKAISFDNHDDDDSVYYNNKFGLKITSPVNNVSITAIITCICDSSDSCGCPTWWTASVVILPNKDLEALR